MAIQCLGTFSQPGGPGASMVVEGSVLAFGVGGHVLGADSVGRSFGEQGSRVRGLRSARSSQPWAGNKGALLVLLAARNCGVGSAVQLAQRAETGAGFLQRV